IHMVDIASGNTLKLVSENVNFTQSRNLIEKSFGNLVSLNESNSASVTIFDGTFDYISSDHFQKLSVIATRMVQCKKNTKSNPNITSNIISVDLLDNKGNNIKISKVGKDPIEIKIYSSAILQNSTCKYYDENENQWKNVSVKSILVGQWLICASDHLTDFATF